MAGIVKTPADEIDWQRLAALRVWVVHDWLTGWRGGEKLLLELVRLFPRAKIATLIHIRGTTHEEIDRRVARVSFLQHLPGIAGGYRNYLPLFPAAVRSLKLDGPCDVVISISHAVAKGARIPRRPDGTQVPHVCYCNSPMRYIWDLEDQYVSRCSPKALALALVKPYLRRFDRKTGEVTAFIGNSGTIAERIRRIYHREAVVVYPGVDEAFYAPAPASAAVAREDFYLAVSALVPYKRIDLAVAAFRAAPRRRLVIIGKGPEEARLKMLARSASNIQFLGWQSDEVARDHYRRCAAFIFPGLEDFGMTPVEAQLCGAPVLAYRAGGATETVVEPTTGLFFDQQTAAALTAAVDRFENCRNAFDLEVIRGNALQFTWARYRQGVAGVVTKVLGAPAP